MSVRLESANSEALNRATMFTAVATDEFTLGGYVYLHSLPSAGAYAPIFSVAQDGAFTGFALFVDDAGHLVIRNHSAAAFSAEGATVLATGQWYYIWFRMTDFGGGLGEFFLYLDESTTAELTETQPGYLSAGVTSLRIGENPSFEGSPFNTDNIDASFFNWKFWRADIAASNAATEAAQAAFATAGLARWLFSDFTDIDDDEGALDLTAVGTHSEGPANPWGAPTWSGYAPGLNAFAINTTQINSGGASGTLFPVSLGSTMAASDIAGALARRANKLLTTTHVAGSTAGALLKRAGKLLAATHASGSTSGALLKRANKVLSTTHVAGSTSGAFAASLVKLLSVSSTHVAGSTSGALTRRTLKLLSASHLAASTSGGIVKRVNKLLSATHVQGSIAGALQARLVFLRSFTGGMGIGGGGGGASLDWWEDFRTSLTDKGLTLVANNATINRIAKALATGTWPSELTHVAENVYVAGMDHQYEALNLWPAPAVGEFLFHRILLNNSLPNPANTGGDHGFQVFIPGEEVWWAWRVWGDDWDTSDPTKFVLEFTSWDDSGVGELHLIVPKDTVLRLEWRIERTGTSTVVVSTRVYNNETGVLLGSSTDHNEAHVSNYREHRYGMSGQGGASHNGGSVYWSAIAVRKSASASDWIGAYPVAGVESAGGGSGGAIGGVLTLRSTKLLTATHVQSSSSGALVKRAGKVLTTTHVAGSTSGVLTKRVSKLLTTTVQQAHISGTLSAVATLTFPVSLSSTMQAAHLSGALSRRTLKLLSATHGLSSTSGALLKRATKLITSVHGASSTSGALQKRAARMIASTMQQAHLSGALTTRFVALLSIASTVLAAHTSGALTKQVRTLLTGSITPAGVLALRTLLDLRSTMAANAIAGALGTTYVQNVSLVRTMLSSQISSVLDVLKSDSTIATHFVAVFSAYPKFEADLVADVAYAATFTIVPVEEGELTTKE